MLQALKVPEAYGDAISWIAIKLRIFRKPFWIVNGSASEKANREVFGEAGTVLYNGEDKFSASSVLGLELL
jgi:hypothetical protein